MKEGPVCLYKDGDAGYFEASEVDQRMSEGWKDHPKVKKTRGPNKPKEKVD